MKQEIPIEDAECEEFKFYLERKGYKFTHIANEIGIAGHIGMLINKKKVKLWLRRGFPDYCIILKRGSLLFIEMKRQKKTLKNWKLWASPSQIKPEQLEWKDALNNVQNVQCEVAYWCKHAQEIVKYMEKVK